MRPRQLKTEGRCVLVYKASGTPLAGRPPIVLLHGQHQDHMQLASLGTVFEPDTVTYALRAPRVQTDGQNVVGHYWYYGDSLCTPEASTLGDSLYQVERFLLDRAEGDAAQAQRFILIGIDQGGVLALTLAGVWPELIQAVIAIDACLPAIPAEANLAQGDVTDMPVLLVRHTQSHGVLADTARALASRRAAVKTVVANHWTTAVELREFIASQLSATTELNS